MQKPYKKTSLCQEVLNVLNTKPQCLESPEGNKASSS